MGAPPSMQRSFLRIQPVSMRRPGLGRAYIVMWRTPSPSEMTKLLTAVIAGADKERDIMLFNSTFRSDEHFEKALGDAKTAAHACCRRRRGGRRAARAEQQRGA
eukprot:234246-Prymnesium_polylepis.1